MLSDRQDERSLEQALSESRRRIFDHPILSAAEEKQLARAIERGSLEAKNRLIECNTRLARKEAARHASYTQHLDIDDLFHAAVLGLTRAAEKFDYRKGFKFSTYATWWIRQSISRTIADREQTIRFPVHLRDALRSIQSFRDHYSRIHGCEPSFEQIAEKVDLSVAQVRQMLATSSVSSLDMPVSTDDAAGATFGELIADPNPIDPFEQALSSSMSTLIANAVENLTSQQRQVLEMRFEEDLDLKSIAKRLNIDASEVRRIEKSAIRALKHIEPLLAA